MEKSRINGRVIMASQSGQIGQEGDEFWDLADLFDTSLRAARRSPRTRQGYREALVLLHAFLSERGMPTDPVQIAREHIEEFLGELAERVSERTGRQISGATVVNRYCSLHAFFSWLVSREEIPRSPMEKIPRPKIKKAPPPVLTETQIGKLLGYLSGLKDFYGRRDYAICVLLLETGLRREEMVSLRLDDVDWETHGLHVRHGKGEKARGVAFGDVAALALRAYLRVRRHYPGTESPMLWIGNRGPLEGEGLFRMVRRRAKQAGVGAVGVHLFRHSWAHYFREGGGSEEDLKVLGGWESDQMPRWYGSSRAAERARRAQKEYSVTDRLVGRGGGKKGR